MSDPNRPLRILIVDDLRTVRVLIPAYFVGMNFEFFEAESGVQALRELHRTRPDLIISDVNMPELDGIEFCHAVHALPGYEDLPVILLTGDAEASRFSVRRNPAKTSALLTKPPDPVQLRELVEEFLSRSTALPA